MAIGYHLTAKQTTEDIKCPSCNWETTILFKFNNKDVGICGRCMAEYIYNENALVVF